MPEAEYTVALILTENLVVARNLDEAERWLKKASDQGLDVAKSALRELDAQKQEEQRHTRPDTSSSSHILPSDTTQSRNPSFLFLDAQSDSLSDVRDPENLERLFSNRGPQLMKALGIPEEAIDTTKPGPPAEQLISTSANVGSPEARIVLGRCHELGRGCPQDVVRAAVYYLSAVRLDSRKAAQFLLDLVQSTDVLNASEARAKNGDNDARFVLAGLSALQLDNRLTEHQSVQLLEEASAQNHIESLLELGVRYSSGRTVPQRREKAIELWKAASALGSREADVRLVATEVFSSSSDPRPSLIDTLVSFANEGASLAQVALAYCYETGTGVESNTAEAARYYRRAASRGSESAYLSLRRLYDQVRPNDKEFQVDEF
jgi:TPR repeat protein